VPSEFCRIAPGVSAASARVFMFAAPGLPTTGKIRHAPGRTTRSQEGRVDARRQTAQFSTLSPGIVPSSKARSFVTNVAPASMA